MESITVKRRKDSELKATQLTEKNFVQLAGKLKAKPLNIDGNIVLEVYGCKNLAYIGDYIIYDKALNLHIVVPKKDFNKVFDFVADNTHYCTYKHVVTIGPSTFDNKLNVDDKEAIVDYKIRSIIRGIHNNLDLSDSDLRFVARTYIALHKVLRTKNFDVFKESTSIDIYRDDIDCTLAHLAKEYLTTIEVYDPLAQSADKLSRAIIKLQNELTPTK